MANLLVVSATASGKTFIGEMAGLKNLLEKRQSSFSCPACGLAYQKYERFSQSLRAPGRGLDHNWCQQDQSGIIAGQPTAAEMQASWLPLMKG